MVGLDLIEGLAVSGRGSAGRRWPRCSGSGDGEGGGEEADQRRVRTGCGDGEADAGRGLDDAGAVPGSKSPGMSSRSRRVATASACVFGMASRSPRISQ